MTLTFQLLETISSELSDKGHGPTLYSKLIKSVTIILEWELGVVGS